MSNLIGKWAVCGHGRIGKIERIVPDVLKDTVVYKGHDLRGGMWRSKAPIILHEDEQSTLEATHTSPGL